MKLSRYDVDSNYDTRIQKNYSAANFFLLTTAPSRVSSTDKCHSTDIQFSFDVIKFINHKDASKQVHFFLYRHDPIHVFFVCTSMT